MKKLIYTLTAICLLLAPSCTVDDAYESGYKTEQGQYAFNIVNGFVIDAVTHADLVSKVSLYRDTDKANKALVKALYFEDYTIEEDEAKSTITLSLLSSAEKQVFYHNNKSVEEAGAEWNYERYYEGAPETYLRIPIGTYVLKSQSENMWSIKVDHTTLLNKSWTRESPVELFRGQMSNYTLRAMKPSEAKASTHYLFDIMEGEGRGLSDCEFITFKFEPKGIADQKYPCKLNINATVNNGVDRIAISIKSKDNMEVTMFSLNEEYYFNDWWMWWWGLSANTALWIY